VRFLLNAVGKAFGHKETLVDLLRASLARVEMPRPYSIIHASDLTSDGFCPRAVALLELLGKERKPRYVNAALAATYDVGHMTADLVRTRWLRGRVVGDWYCDSCGLFKSFQRAPDPVESMVHVHAWRYKEVKFWSPEYKFEGSLDAIVDLGGPKLVACELKIIDKDEYRKLAAPYAEHRLRTNLYLRLVEYSDHPHRGEVDTSRGKVLYVMRGFGLKNGDVNEVLPFREFDVYRDDADTDRLVAESEAIDVFRQTGVVPVGKCDVSYCPRAKVCPVVTECFSGKFQPKYPLPNSAYEATLGTASQNK
jgi:hypothetical protein